jgi:molybdate transport system ATP-binding protein
MDEVLSVFVGRMRLARKHDLHRTPLIKHHGLDPIEIMEDQRGALVTGEPSCEPDRQRLRIEQRTHRNHLTCIHAIDGPALARALAREPKVLLLDEPLAALDPHTRAHVREELHGLLREVALPTLLVTHSFEDAAALADRAGVLVDGRLLQLGTPQDLVAAPADAFVATFAGGNVLHGTARPGARGLTEVEVDGATVYSTDAGEGPVSLVVYPWEIALARAAPADSAVNHVEGEIRSLVSLGNRVRVRVGPLTAEVTAASAERLGLAAGQRVVASFKATGARLLPR